MATDLGCRMKEGASKLVCLLIKIASKWVYTIKACEDDLRSAQAACLADGYVNLTEPPGIGEIITIITSLAGAGVHKDEQESRP